MIRFLIASHVRLADGFKSTVEVIIGKDVADKIETVSAFIGESIEDAKGRLEAVVKAIPKEEQVIIFSDIMHGSVNQYLMPFVDDERVFLITGTSFPLVCDIIIQYCFYEDAKVAPEELAAAVERAKDEIIFVNQAMKKEQSEKNEDDFFE